MSAISKYLEFDAYEMVRRNIKVTVDPERDAIKRTITVLSILLPYTAVMGVVASVYTCVKKKFCLTLLSGINFLCLIELLAIQMLSSLLTEDTVDHRAGFFVAIAGILNVTELIL